MKKTIKAYPGYRTLAESGELAVRAEAADKILSSCRLCPRECKINRLGGETGVCRAGPEAVVSSHGPHFGEERPLVGRNGSGTIFFTYCNLGCVFCQNYDISHLGMGNRVSSERLAGMMMDLEKVGCHNVNLVTPTHMVPQILRALMIAAQKGLRLPLVYNCGGYESKEVLELLDGVVDIYMPDFKFWDREIAKQLAKAPDYSERAREAIREMHRQVGDLTLDSDGIAVRGLLVRHLVLPQGMSGTSEVMGFLAREISRDTYVNVMDQYRPCYLADGHQGISRPLREREFAEAIDLAVNSGLRRLDQIEFPRYRVVRL